MKNYQYRVAQKLMTQIAYGKEQLAVHVDADEAGRLRKAFDTAWKRASNGDDRNAADLLKTELSRAQDLRRSEKGTPEQRKFAKDLKAVRDAFGEEGIIAEAPLTGLLEHSLREVKEASTAGQRSLQRTDHPAGRQGSVEFARSPFAGNVRSDRWRRNYQAGSCESDQEDPRSQQRVQRY